MSKRATEEKTVYELLIDFTLPPPIYGYHLTTHPWRAERTIKLVKSIGKVEGGIIVTALTEETYIIPAPRVQYWREE